MVKLLKKLMPSYDLCSNCKRPVLEWRRRPCRFCGGRSRDIGRFTEELMASKDRTS